MNRAGALVLACLLAPLSSSAGEKFTTEDLELGSVAKAAIEKVEQGYGGLKFAMAPECPREVVAAIASVRPAITLSQLQALAPKPARSSYFIFTSLRISALNPEWAWCEGHYSGGPYVSFGLSRGSDAVWRAGSLSITYYC